MRREGSENEVVGEEDHERYRKWRGLISDEVKVDYLENDLDEEFEKDLEALLLRSEDDAKEVDTLRELKETIRAGDDVPLPESGLYFDALEARIMGALNEAIEAGEVSDRRRRLFFVQPLKFATPVRGMLAKTGHAFIVGGIALALMGKWLISGDGAESGRYVAREPQSSRATEVEAAQRAAPQVLSETVIGFEQPGDIALDLASESAAWAVAQHRVSIDGSGQDHSEFAE